eukprot:466291-Rhodomonas_salina.1
MFTDPTSPLLSSRPLSSRSSLLPLASLPSPQSSLAAPPSPVLSSSFSVPQTLRRVGVNYVVMNLLGAFMDQVSQLHSANSNAKRSGLVMNLISQRVRRTGVVLVAHAVLSLQRGGTYWSLSVGYGVGLSVWYCHYYWGSWQSLSVGYGGSERGTEALVLGYLAEPIGGVWR